jgi:hypothetical protein
MYFNPYDHDAYDESIDLSVGWHHVAMTFDYSTNESKFWADGVVVATASAFDALSANSETLWFAREHVNTYAFTDFTIAGAQISNSVLYTSSFVPEWPLVSNANTVSLWTMHEDTGTSLVDYSGSNNGTIDGATWVEDCPEAPEEPAASALSCLDILESGDSTGDGTYWIDPDGTGAFEAYCDMTTDGGGWTALFIMNETTYDYSTGGSSSDVVDNERWSYDGTASTTYINELDSGGEYSQPATWTMNFVEWQVGSPSQGMYSTTVATSFDSTIVLAMFSGTDVQAGHVDGGYKCLGTCLAVPGADYSATFEEFHFAFNQSRPSSAHECRFSTGINDDVGFNDAVLGLMCNYYEGSPLMAYRHLVADGFTLMGR